MTQADLNQYATKSAQPGLSVATLSRVSVPVPPLEEQRRIVAILDKFDALVNDISSGLPAEIEARRKQYEHYRDRLLTFPELNG
ncbi:restriction endonuclease subunit S [Trueperella pyogenes]|uniref:restriction endonuclease subunit S n=1 Tax=Trueperella pyogenes TaxID=1661 RepID=UPI001901E638|nr:restriction endonuclease subunit S [Trueperella pyogenes]